MKILLDTHTAIWALADHPYLTKTARDIISDPDNVIYYSSVSTWEILLKNESVRNELELTPELFVKYCNDAGYYPMNMTSEHVIMAEGLDNPGISKEHKDPFDRMLLAQAKAENCRFLTHDDKILLYNEKCVIHF